MLRASLRQRLVYEVSLQRMEENVFLAQNLAFPELGKYEDATRNSGSEFCFECLQYFCPREASTIHLTVYCLERGKFVC